MRLTESFLRQIIKEELQNIVESDGYFNPGGIDISPYEKNVENFMKSKRRAASWRGKKLPELLNIVQNDIETIKNNPPQDKSEWHKLREKIINTLESIEIGMNRY